MPSPHAAILLDIKHAVAMRSAASRPVALAIALTCLGAAANAQEYANSSTQFSGTQGQFGWYYGYYGDNPQPMQPGLFRQFPLFAAVPGLTNGEAWYLSDIFWTNIGRDVVVPHGGSQCTRRDGRADIQWAARRWMSNRDGPVRFRLEVQDIPPYCFPPVNPQGDGIIARVFINGQQQTFFPVAQRGSTIVDLAACISAGDLVDFVSDPGPLGACCDQFSYKIQVLSPIVTQPQDTQTLPNVAATFSIVASALDIVAYQWQIQTSPPPNEVWQSLSSDPADFPCSQGGTITAFATPANSPTASIGVIGCLPATGPKNWPIRCVVTTACGAVTSSPATLTILSLCDNPSDITDIGNTGAGPDGQLTVDDIIAFVNAFGDGC